MGTTVRLKSMLVKFARLKIKKAVQGLANNTQTDQEARDNKIIQPKKLSKQTKQEKPKRQDKLQVV